MRTLIPFIALSMALASTLPASAMRQDALCTELLEASPAFWKKIQNQLESDLKNPERLISKYRIDSRRLIRGQLIGAGTSGNVYADSWAGKRVATKIYHPKPEFSESVTGYFLKTLAVQETLGALGIAPTLLGVYWTPSNEMGIVMERMDPLSSTEFLPKNTPFKRSIDMDRLTSQVRAFRSIFSALELVPFDLQCLISEDGTLYVNDFDAYVLDPGGRTTQVFIDGADRLLRIQLGLKVPDAIVSEVISPWITR